MGPESSSCVQARQFLFHTYQFPHCDDPGCIGHDCVGNGGIGGINDGPIGEKGAEGCIGVKIGCGPARICRISVIGGSGKGVPCIGGGGKF
jgi:hypothetical protein